MMNLKSVLFFHDWSRFQDAAPSPHLPPPPLNAGLKVLFPRDLKVTRHPHPPPPNKHARSNARERRLPAGMGKRHKKKSEKKTKNGWNQKMYSPPCFANSVGQISNNTDSLPTSQGESRGRLAAGRHQGRGRENRLPPTPPHTEALPPPLPPVPELSGVLAEFSLPSYPRRDEGAGEYDAGFPGLAERRRILRDVKNNCQ